jgi:hypothetical protein
MKIALSFALAAALLLSGCSVFHRSPTWASVVASRSHYSDSGSADAKDGYIGHLHQVLEQEGVEHRVVTYQFHFHNVYREEGVQTATVILYRDETSPNNPWWAMDEYHHVPMWLPNGEPDYQIEFFTQHHVDIVSVRDFTGHAAAPASLDKTERPPRQAFSHSAREKKFRSLFAGANTRPKAAKRSKAPAEALDTDPLTTNVLSGHPAAASEGADSRAAALFRTTHGTQFDPGSSVDRAKMAELRRQLLNRTPRVSLRN